ncbi:MAG: isochorismatase family protein [Alphaproteobacteria bacterium]
MTEGKNDGSSDRYREMGYDGQAVGFGDRPGIVVVDFQRGFTEKGFALGGSPMIDAAVEQTARLLGPARAMGIPIASCRMAYQDRRQMPRWKITLMYEGELFIGHPATEIDPRIHDESDLVVEKTAPSIFFQTPVAAYFTRHNVDTVIVTGCNTSGCIRASVIDSFSHGWHTIIALECISDVEAGPHEANLLDMGRRYADLRSLDEVLAYLEQLRQPDRPE